MDNQKKEDGQNQEYINLPSSIGPYEIKEKINEGGYSKIYLGFSKYTKDKVSIKIIDKSLFITNPDDLILIKNEIDVLKILKHRNILTLYGIYESPRYIFIVTEYLQSELLNLILNKKRLSESDALKIFIQMIDALLYIHKMEICHRDIRIEHVLLDSNNIPKLIDFGYSCFYKKGNSLNEPIGSLSYACPEIIQQNSYNPELADVWSLGVCLYVMLCGYLPFSEEDEEMNNKLIISGKVDYPTEIGNKCKDLLKKMLEVNPKKRYNLIKISRHPWVKSSQEIKIIGGYNIYEIIYPIDERLLKIIKEYGLDTEKVKNDLKLNKFNDNTGLFKIISKKVLELKYGTISDFTSNSFIEYMKEEKNSIKDGQIKYTEYLKKLEEKRDIFKNTILEYKIRENNVINKINELEKDEEEVVNENENKENSKEEEDFKNTVKKKEGNDNFKRKKNKHASLLERKLTQNIKEKKNKVIQDFIDEYADENSVDKNNKKATKRKNSFKTKKNKLDLEIIYEENESQKDIKKIIKPHQRKSQLFTIFKKPERLRRTSIATSKTKLLMKKPEKNKNIDIVEEQKDDDDDDCKSQKSNDSKSSESQKKENQEIKEKENEKDIYGLSFDEDESNEKSDTHSIQIDSSFISKSVNESENNYNYYKQEEKIENRNKKEKNDNSINENGEKNQNFKMFSFDIVKTIEKNLSNLQKINKKEETIEYIENIRNEKFKKEKKDNINEITETNKFEEKIINDDIKNEIQLNDGKNKENNNIIYTDKNIKNIEKEEYEINKNDKKLLGEKKTDDLSNIKNNNKNENQSEKDIFSKVKGKYKENYNNIKIIKNKKTESNENKRYYDINNDENENHLNINIKKENNRENVEKNIYLRNRKNKNKEDIKKTLSINKNDNYENKDNLEKDNNIEFINELQKISKYNNKKIEQKENEKDLFELENLGNKDLFKTRNRKKNIYSNDKKSHTLSIKHNKLKNKINFQNKKSETKEIRISEDKDKYIDEDNFDDNLFQKRIPFLFNINKKNDQDNQDNKDTINSKKIISTIILDKINVLKDNQSRNNAINIYIKNESKKGSTFLSISQENNNNLSCSNQYKEKNKIINIKNNQILYKIPNFNDEEDIIEDSNKSNNTNDLRKLKFFSNKEVYLNKKNYGNNEYSPIQNDILNYKSSKLVSINSKSKEKNKYNKKINNYKYNNEEEKSLEKERRLRKQKNKLKEELNKIKGCNKLFLNEYNKNYNIKNNNKRKEENNFKNKEEFSKTERTIGLTNNQPLINNRIIVKNINKNQLNIENKIKEKYNILNNLNKNEKNENLNNLNKDNLIDINKNYNNFQISNILSPTSINSKDKISPLTFITNYYKRKDELNIEYKKKDTNNDINFNNKMKSKNVTVFDILKDINCSRSYNINNYNNDLINKLNKFKGKKINKNISNSKSRNKSPSKYEFSMDKSYNQNPNNKKMDISDSNNYNFNDFIFNNEINSQTINTKLLYYNEFNDSKKKENNIYGSSGSKKGKYRKLISLK